jgi:2-dehydropantoate 2-reductase
MNPIAHRLKNYQVLTSVQECQRFAPDQIWFATPSPVYHSEWFREFLQKVPAGRVVGFAPEGGRPEFFPSDGARDRLVFGGVTFMAWQGDLGGGGGRPGGVNFCLSPLAFPLSGTEKACGEVAAVFKKAGLRVQIQKPGSSMQASMTAVMTAFTAGLELSGWSLRGFRKSPWLQRAARASREAVFGQLRAPGFFPRALVGMICSTPALFIIDLILPLLFPFEIEKYLAFHYRKTREQTLTLLRVFISDGERQGLSVEHIRILLQGLLDSAR